MLKIFAALLRGSAGPRRPAVRRVWDRLRRAHRRHGVIGLCKLLPKNVLHALNYRRRRLRRSLDEFDRRFGVDTAMHRSVSALDVAPELALHAARYEPIAAIDPYLRSLGVSFAGYHFIDFGCGKGRALLMASDFPFSRIIGVEYSAELASVARRNISIYRSASQICKSIAVIEGNAASFDPPDGPSVYFFHNPFDGIILDRVLARIEKNPPAGTKDHYLIYVDPRHRSRIEAVAGWEIAADHRGWVAYRWRSTTARQVERRSGSRL
jgi:SAM-dependent methyltransferase